MIKDLLEKAAKERAVEVIKQLLKDEEEQGDIFFTDEDKDALKLAIKVLSAPAVPEGEWIKHIDDLFPEDSFEECPFCHEEQRLVGNDDNFCPNCGAKLKMPY